jgi:uncharacterized membrane protein (TIGR01666 family)
MYQPREQKIRYFLYSQYLADGIRTTLEIIIPVFILAQFGYIEAGFSVALGALCVSICDAPGPVEHKKNGMLYGNLFVFLMTLLTGFLNGNALVMGVLVGLSSFFFTMISVYGARAAAVGTAALLAMILRMTKLSTPGESLEEAVLILAGGIWYFLFALIFYRITPYRPAQRSLGLCIHETAAYLRIKGELYDINTSFEEEYRKLLSQQVVVTEKQETVRELLYKNRELTKETTRQGKILILTFSDLMDLYEQINATWYDYESLRKTYKDTGILSDVSLILHQLADELDAIGLSIQSNHKYERTYDLIDALNAMKLKVDALQTSGRSTLVLKKVLVNLRTLGEKIDDVARYFEAGFHENRKLFSDAEYKKFVSHQQVDLNLLVNNLHLESAAFRHSIRMMLTCLVGYWVTETVSYGNHSYWVLLTTIVILKPGFGLTKERNVQRLVGTVAGATIGLLITYFVHNRDILFGLIVFFMLGTYSFQRINYRVMVIFTTPYVIILFNLLGLKTWAVAEERLIDTAFAGFLAFLANYFLFPHWESKHISSYLNGVLKANINYLKMLREVLSGNQVSVLEYKLARKELFVSISNLSAAFHRMLTEPANKQKSSKEIYQFVVLNHVLSSNVASLSAHVLEGKTIKASRESLIKVQTCINHLEDTLIRLDPQYMRTSMLPINPAEGKETDKHLSQQLDYMKKVSAEIYTASLQIKSKDQPPVISREAA